MNQQIPVSAYTSDVIFLLERQRIFLSMWQPVAMLVDLQHNNDFVVAEIGGKSIVVQNFNGEIGAFTNVCSHRFSAIQTLPKGNRPLQCPYHRWTFDKSGVPRTIPLREDFECLAGEDPEKLALERWHVECCGGIVFVCFKEPTSSLREFLGNTYDWLAAITTNLGEELASYESDIDANWKVIMQNTVEFHHVFSVHPETFKPMIELPINILDREAPAPHIRYLTRMNLDKGQTRMDALLEKYFVRPAPVPASGYEHLLVFPALTLGHTNGRAFSFFQYRPQAPARTRLSVRTWLPRLLRDNAVGKEIVATVGAGIAEFIQRLAHEDTKICVAAQRGLSTAPEGWKMRFSKGEFLVARFQSMYMDLMRSDAFAKDAAF